uniref:Uncharacterized protein n=1 Tax=Aegilops tauschii subsp. strangulata TaxID=200361 RepID=A0A453DJ83_AEGTS
VFSFSDRALCLSVCVRRVRCSYYIDLDVNKAEDVLLHRRILAECADPDNRPVFHARFLRVTTHPSIHS